MAAVDDALAGVFERLPVFDQAPGAFEIGGEDYVAASVVGDGKVAISPNPGNGSDSPPKTAFCRTRSDPIPGGAAGWQVGQKRQPGCAVCAVCQGWPPFPRYPAYPKRPE
jgi:hypothetical protein